MTISTIIWDRRAAEFDSLSIGVIALEKELGRLKQKMETEGMTGNYSINTDVLRHAQRIHMASRMLYTLKSMQIYEDTLNREVLNQEDRNDTRATCGTIPFASGSIKEEDSDDDFV